MYLKERKRIYGLVCMEKRRNDAIINSKIKNKSKTGKKEKRKTKPNNNKTKYITKFQCIHFQNTLLGNQQTAKVSTKCFTVLLIIREMKIIAESRCHVTSVRIVAVKRQKVQAWWHQPRSWETETIVSPIQNQLKFHCRPFINRIKLQNNT